MKAEAEAAITALVPPIYPAVNAILDAKIREKLDGDKKEEKEEKEDALLMTSDFLSTENDPDYVAEDALSTPTAHYPRPRLTTIQSDERGAVPVLVHPESMLMPTVVQTGIAYETMFNGNTMVVGADDLTITQLADDVTAPDEDDSVTLQVNGVPVLVHPESMLLPTVDQSGAKSMRIFTNGGTMVIGADEISATQTKDDNMSEESVVLQVNGVPVEVNPESMLMPTVTQSGTASMRLFPTGSITIGVDEITAVQKSAPTDKAAVQVSEPFVTGMDTDLLANLRVGQSTISI